MGTRETRVELNQGLPQFPQLALRPLWLILICHVPATLMVAGDATAATSHGPCPQRAHSLAGLVDEEPDKTVLSAEGEGGRDCQGWGGWHGRKRWVRGRTAELQAGPGKDRKRRRLPS